MEMLNWLKEYLTTTPKEIIKKEWGEVEALGFEGPNAFAYMNFLTFVYDCEKLEHCPPKEILFSENMTPSFSESFFFAKIAA